MNIKTIVLLIIAGIVATTISGCVQEKAPEQPSLPAPKYMVRIMGVSDATDRYPDLSAQAPGWYNPLTRQKVSRYVDPNLGTIHRRVVVLLSTPTAPETKLGLVLKPHPKQGIFFYENIYEDGVPLSRYYSKHQREARQVYEILVEYDVPEKEELTVKDEQGMALQIYSTSLNENFKIVFAEPNTLPEGYS